MIYFSSDTHYYHENVIKYCSRPFSNVEEMNKAMFNNWNEIVKPEDIVYFLGDFSMAARSAEVFTPKLNGTKHLIHGNHDFTHPYHKKSRKPENQKEWISKYKSWGWETIQDELILEHNGIKLRLHHMPYPFIGEGSWEDKYKNYRPKDDGTVLLHGHIHDKGFIQKSQSGTLMINVGVDVFDFKPVSIDRIMEIIKRETE